MNHPILGILGGVGPLATACFMEMIINKTHAQCDQDNIPMIIYNDPQIPDRTAYILGKSDTNPVPEMIKMARKLEKSGVDYIAIPCNTAHYFYEEIQRATALPVLNIMQLTAQDIAHHSVNNKVGLMATEGTAKSKVFQNFFNSAHLETILPNDQEQAIITFLIYDCVKSGKPANIQAFLDVAHALHERGCGTVVVGCTELSVIYQQLEQRPDYLVDSLDILANACVEYYFSHHTPTHES
ncbi:aspartate/glutamate racemase family protein [uncultured Olegusella sp.]|uniref:aspartate/glutamate racemase family protein n=1 Tax=uncultured Olegusella sp. TaxID=1979846 RepID=UPI002603C1F0|nr:amino acid racemase [uncultured Olegusella sp.]